jgi:hypothetical protein
VGTPGPTTAALEQRVEQLNGELGPIVVVAKGHSGSRFLAEILQRSGVFIGADLNGPFDSMSWHEDFALPLMTSEHWPDLPDTADVRAFTDRAMEATLRRFLGPSAYRGGPWGWKGSTLFVMPVVLRYFPQTRVIHLIRDGRDVATSEDGLLNLPFHFELRRRNPVRMASRVWEAVTDRRRRNDYRLKVFFGRSDLEQWEDVPLDRANVLANRYLLQMQSWMRNVTAARQLGTVLGDRYLEVRYEELVTDPSTVVERVLEWLHLPMDADTATFAASHARTGSLRKWERAELPADRQRDFERAVEHGRPLLVELGYLEE